MPRLQGAFATNDEIKGVVDFVIKNNVASYDESIQDAFENGVQSTDDTNNGNREVEFLNDAPQREKVDELFKVAVKLVMLNGSASISLLQRKLAIGYARAGKIIDQMEERGFIASAMGAKQRKVLISPDQFRDEFGEEYNS